MNADEISPKTNPRLKRIQKISAYFRTLFFVSALLFVVIGVVEIIELPILHISDLAHSNPSRFRDAIFMGVSIICWTAETWFAYKLFFFYARGDLFTPEIVRYLRRIGYVSILIGFWSAFKLYFLFGFLGDNPSAAGAIAAKFGVILVQLVFSIVPGFVTIFIAWVMDEGRKIQEEQELTV
jgi:hypothetical protein